MDELDVLVIVGIFLISGLLWVRLLWVAAHQDRLP